MLEPKQDDDSLKKEILTVEKNLQNSQEPDRLQRLREMNEEKKV